MGKRLELLKEVLPAASRLVAIYSFANGSLVFNWEELQAAAQKAGVEAVDSPPHLASRLAAARMESGRGGQRGDNSPQPIHQLKAVA